WASRSANRNTRLNATYILASVADNTNLCIVLDHLRDPDLSADGRVNLLQVAKTVAPYAYSDNVEQILAVTTDLKKLRAAPNENLTLTKALLGDLETRAKESINFNIGLPDELPGCKGYVPVFERPR